MTGLEKLYACRDIRSAYQSGDLDVVTAVVEVHEIMTGGRQDQPLTGPRGAAVLDFLHDSIGARPGLPGRG